MCSICSCQLNIWHAGHSLAPILNWFLLPELTPKLASVDSWIVPVLHYHREQSHLKILNLQITLIMWRCQYEESNWDWWIARTAITCPKNFKTSKFCYFYRKTIVKSWGTEKMNQFRPNQFKVISSWKLGDAKKLSLIERGAKNENFKIFVIFCLNFIFSISYHNFGLRTIPTSSKRLL